ncbi:MAG: hypothetical protein OHK006_14690 [Thermodesulfovibrionales bacterium]
MKRLAALFVLLIGAACSMPETRIYSLNMLAERPAQSAPRSASVAVAVQANRYLGQPYIAHRVSPYQLDLSRYAKWEASPSDMVRDALRDALIPSFREVRASQVAATGFYTLQVNLKRFEMSGAASAELAMDVQVVTPEGREVIRRSIAKKSALDASDYVSLAKGMSTMLGEAVAEIKADLLQHVP